jgi:hypothetical protein
MKKIASFAVIGILLCVLTISLAYAGYEIVWSGDDAGSIPTTETSRTEQASIELFNELFPDGYYPGWDVGAPYPEGTCFPYPYSSECVPDNCVGYYYYEQFAHASADLLVCESGTWIEDFHGATLPGGPYVPPFVREGSWDVFLDDAPDSDGDGIPDANDNCPTVSNSRQLDADGDGIGNICDNDSINVTINADTNPSVTIKLYKPSCGGDELVGSLTAYAGYGYTYSFNGLEDGRYLIVATKSGYDFNPGGYWVDIPQTEIQSYDFTATAD